VSDPQIVAWWDFGVDGLPPPGATWDSLHPVPTDSVGHGTGTASLVGGATLGTCPGVKLAIAKVADARGDLTGDIGAAMRWASVTLGADVISMSFGSSVATLAAADDLDERAQEAWQLGALPVASVGNGADNLGVKEPNEAHSPSYSPYVLAVGASDARGTRWGTLVASSYSNLDPDLLAWGTDVPMAAPGGGTVTASGTSFSAPKVAGYAACLMRAAHAAGQDASPGRVAQLLEATARSDATLPYALQGYGFVDDRTVADALGAAHGSGAPGAGAASAAQGAAVHAGRGAVTGAEPLGLLTADPQGRPGVVPGPSLPAGLERARLYHVHAASRQQLALHLGYAAGPAVSPMVPDLDLYLLQPHAEDDGVLRMDEVLADSIQTAQAGADHEDIAIAAGLTGDYDVLVLGYTLTTDQPFALDATLDGQPAQLQDQGGVALAGAFQELN
jgi:hypothetical protein